ncbi:TRAP transporter substrate-binding protein [Bacillus sp. Marseille-P3661]|uniref:TRAP transporter substrate-binding protein n=1 Tax=Bacillus sp. Marseille-P3661 TaxID=1936234 RepID=UPI0015E171D6|nr:TRAP transporter substrate-binding protein [Bacillus sp. Marseille-P3661]
MKKKGFSLLVVLICAAFLFSGCGSGQEAASQDSSNNEKRVFKITHVAGEDFVWTRSMKKFEEELTARSNGRFSLEIFTNGSLGGEADMMQQMKAGSLEMAWVTTAEMSNRSNAFNAWALPYLIKDIDHAKELAYSDEGQGILDTISADEGVHTLGYAIVEPRHVLMKDAQITDFNEFKGKKIRVTPSPINIDWYETIGAAPTPLSLHEVYPSLQTGVIDGVDTGSVVITSNKLDEIAQDLIKTNHVMFNGVGFVSQKVWDSLSAEDQKIIQESFDVATEYNYDIAKKEDEQGFETFKANGGKVFEIENMDDLNQVAEKFYDKYAQEDELIKAFIEKAKELRP